jgi:hypothetical protein
VGRHASGKKTSDDMVSSRAAGLGASATLCSTQESMAPPWQRVGPALPDTLPDCATTRDQVIDARHVACRLACCPHQAVGYNARIRHWHASAACPP